jgi:hypothetical protein
MRRTISAATLLLTVAALASGCGYFKKGPKNYEVFLEAPGTQVQNVVYSLPPDTESPGGDGKRHTNKESNPELPFRRGLVLYPGGVTFTVTPKTGAAATCVIIVEKKQVAKKVGKPGAPVTCSTNLAA